MNSEKIVTKSVGLYPSNQRKLFLLRDINTVSIFQMGIFSFSMNKYFHQLKAVTGMI